ncbi:MAG TPA: hypothetical protein VF902_00440 [Coriobacteriia bacterium]
MPANVIIGLFALLVALVAYSIGVWGAFRKKGATPMHLGALWVGVVFDIAATASMSYSLGWKLENSLHTYLALAAFFGMTIVAALATWAWVKKNDALRATLAKWAVAPWVLWVGVFVWGMLARAPKR